MANKANESENMQVENRPIPTISEKPDNPGEPKDIFTSSGWGGGDADTPKAHSKVVKTRTMAAPSK